MNAGLRVLLGASQGSAADVNVESPRKQENAIKKKPKEFEFFLYPCYPAFL